MKKAYKTEILLMNSNVKRLIKPSVFVVMCIIYIFLLHKNIIKKQANICLAMIFLNG